VGIKHLHRKYELKEAISYLDEPESKTKWTRTVKEAVYKKWVDKIPSLEVLDSHKPACTRIWLDY
jgi:hypothetical protein